MLDDKQTEKRRTLRKLAAARRDFPLKEIIITLALILCLWVTDVFVLHKAYDRKYFLVVDTARKTLKHCRDMVVNRVREGVYRVQTCHTAYIYKVKGTKARLVDIKPVVKNRWAN